MKVAYTAALALALALPARAEPAPVNPPVDAIDEQGLQRVVDHELGELAGNGHLQVTLPGDGRVTLTYTRPGGTVLSRTVPLPIRNDDAVEIVTLLAQNMVRDQTSDMLADLTLTLGPPPRTVWFAAGIVPPISTDLLYGEPVVSHISWHLLIGSSRGFRGVALAGVADIEGDIAVGLQISGAASLALADLSGVQLAGMLSATLGHLRGVQLAPINYARAISGLQLGTINIAGRVNGLQLGVFNYSSSADGAAVGLISIVRHGLTEAETWAESIGTVGLLLRHGRPHFYNSYGVQTALTPGGSYIVLTGLGLGSRLVATGRVNIDLGLLGWTVNGAGIDASLSLLTQLRLAVALHLGDRAALFGGAAVSVYTADNNEDGAALHPALDWTWQQDATTVRLWPTFFAGLRLR